MNALNFKCLYGSEKTILKIGNVEIGCFIIEHKQCVLHKRDVIRALGYEGKSENWLADILHTINKFSPLPNEILTNWENPLKILIENSSLRTQVLEGIFTHLFLEVCQVLTLAEKEGYLNVNQLKYAKAAARILSYCKDQDIDELIFEVTGYNLYKYHTKEHLLQFLNSPVKDDSLLWIRTFPDSIFEVFLEIHQLDWKNLYENPQVFGNIILEVVFNRISTDLLTKLRIQKPKRDYRRNNKQCQDQLPELKIYLSEVCSLLETAGRNWNIFLLLLNRRHPKRVDFGNKLPAVSKNSQNKAIPLSLFNTALKKCF